MCDQQRAAAAHAAALAPTPLHGAPPVAGAVACGVTLVKEEEEEDETLAQLRDRLGLSARASAPGPRAPFVHIKVEDSTDGEDTDGEEEDTGWGGEARREGEKIEEGHGEEEEVQKKVEEEMEKEEEQDEEAAVEEEQEEEDKDTIPQDVQQEGGLQLCSKLAKGVAVALLAGDGGGNRGGGEIRDGEGNGDGADNGSEKGDVERAGVGEGRGFGSGGERGFTSNFRGVTPQSRSSGRWVATFKHNGRAAALGSFDSEADAARAWDRMMVWCDLHGVVLKLFNGKGVHTSDSIRAALNFHYQDYEGEVDELRGILSQDSMAQRLKQQGREQPGGRKRNPAGGGDRYGYMTRGRGRKRGGDGDVDGAGDGSGEGDVDAARYGEGVGVDRGVGDGGGERGYTSKFRGVIAKSCGAGRWEAMFCHNDKGSSLVTFDSEEDAARAWDRMVVWCDLHGVVLKRLGGKGVHTSDSIKAALNFTYEDYAGEVNELRSIVTQDAMKQKLQQEGRLQPGYRKHKRKRTRGGAAALSAGGCNGGGGGAGGGWVGGGSSGGNMGSDGNEVGAGNI